MGQFCTSVGDAKG